MAQIVREEALGQKPGLGLRGVEAEAFRQAVRADIAAMAEQGIAVEIPGEWPETDKAQ